MRKGMEMPKKKTPLKTSQKKKTGPLVTAEVPVMPQSPSSPPPRFSPFSPKRLAFLGILLVLGWYFSGKPSEKGQVTSLPSQPQAIRPEWGKPLSLDKMASYDAPNDAIDFSVEKDNKFIYLSNARLDEYINDKLTQTANIAAGANRALASNGKSIVVTNSDNATVLSFDRNLALAGTTNIEKAQRLLGVAWSAHNQVWAVSDVNGTHIFLLSAKGKVVGRIAPDKSQIEGAGFVYDISSDPQHGLIVTDLQRRTLRFLPKNDVGESRVFAMPCSGSINRRNAMIKGHIYIPCPDEGIVLIMSSNGEFEGHFKVKGASMARAGTDGALYVFGAGKILQFKPI